MRRIAVLAAVLASAASVVSLNNAAAAELDVSRVPAVIQRWFDGQAEAYLGTSLATESKDYAEASPEVKKALAAGAMPHAGRVVAELELNYPAFDLRAGKLDKSAETLPEALSSDGRYCASVTIDGLFTDSILCAPLTEKADREYFSDQSYSSGLLDGRTELPAAGFIDTLAGMFTYDVATQTATAMDDLALWNVPQGTVSVSEFQTALARGEAERTLFFEKYGPKGGGEFPLFGGSADERAKRDAEIASLLADSGTDAGASSGDAVSSRRAVQEQATSASSQRAISTSPSAARVAGGVAGIAVLAVLGVGLWFAAVRRRAGRRSVG